MNICLFKKKELGSPLDIRDRRAEHLIKVLHKKVGDSFEAGVIGDSAGHATITAITVQDETSSDGRKTYQTGSLSFDFVPETDGKPLNPLIMVIGFPRPIQLKRLLRDMAGLGVAEVHLTGTELGEKSYLKSDLATSDAGYEMLLEGTEQAASTHVPLLFHHDNLEHCLSSIEENHPGALKLALDNKAPSQSLSSYLAQAGTCPCAVAAIGSERGWTDRERSVLCAKKYTLLGMGNRVLRTETASTVAASLILAALGCLD